MKRDKGSTAETDRDRLERQVEELRCDTRNLKLEHDLLKKANELVKKIGTPEQSGEDDDG